MVGEGEVTGARAGPSVSLQLLTLASTECWTWGVSRSLQVSGTKALRTQAGRCNTELCSTGFFAIGSVRERAEISDIYDNDSTKVMMPWVGDRISGSVE